MTNVLLALILLTLLAYWYHAAHNFVMPRKLFVWRKRWRRRREVRRLDREKRRALKRG